MNDNKKYNQRDRILSNLQYTYAANMMMMMTSYFNHPDCV